MTTVKFMKSGYPVCACSESKDPYWCEHIKKYLDSGEDANLINPGDIVVVPLFPTQGTWAKAMISYDVIGSSSALMDIVYQPDFGKDEKIIPIGFWNKGEGRMSIRSVILDKLRSEIDPRDDNNSRIIRYTKCPSSTHSFASETAIVKNRSATWKWACLWNIYIEGACTPCREASGAPSASVPDINPPPPAWKATRHKNKTTVKASSFSTRPISSVNTASINAASITNAQIDFSKLGSTMSNLVDQLNQIGNAANKRKM